MVDTTTGDILVESPQIQVNLPDGQPFTFVDSVRAWLEDTVDKLKSGSDEAVAGVFIVAMILVAGVVIWRRV